MYARHTPYKFFSIGTWVTWPLQHHINKSWKRMNINNKILTSFSLLTNIFLKQKQYQTILCPFFITRIHDVGDHCPFFSLIVLFFYHYFLFWFVEDVCVAIEQSNIIILTNSPICLDYIFHIPSFFFFESSVENPLQTFPCCVVTMVLMRPSLLERDGHCTPNWDYVA